MAGGKGKIHEHPNANTNGLDKNPQNINQKGRKPSLKKQLAKVGLSDGWMEFKKRDIKIDGDIVRVRVPKEEELALKVFEIANGSNPNAAMTAIKLYAETFDGKADQTLKHKFDSLEGADPNLLTYDQQIMFVHLLDIMLGKKENDGQFGLLEVEGKTVE